MRNERGFSLIEAMVVVALLVPAMGVVLDSTRTVNDSLSRDDSIAKSMEALQRSVTRLAHMIRPCSLATYRMLADDTDVAIGLAEHRGDWIEPRPGAARSSINFRSADGRLAMNARNLTPVRTVRFVMDPAESDNDVDDDNDGLVDEGRIVMTYDGIEVTLVADAEVCTFQLDDRLLTIEVRSAVRRRGEGVRRFRFQEVLYLRNN